MKRVVHGLGGDLTVDFSLSFPTCSVSNLLLLNGPCRKILLLGSTDGNRTWEESDAAFIFCDMTQEVKDISTSDLARNHCLLRFCVGKKSWSRADLLLKFWVSVGLLLCGFSTDLDDGYGPGLAACLKSHCGENNRAAMVGKVVENWWV